MVINILPMLSLFMTFAAMTASHLADVEPETEQLDNLPRVLYLESPEAKMQTLAFADLHPSVQFPALFPSLK